MKEELLARRQQAEGLFNKIQNSIEYINKELQQYGFKTIFEAESELVRLQGEFRVVEDLLSKVKEPSPVSPKADTIDVTAATKEKK